MLWLYILVGKMEIEFFCLEYLNLWLVILSNYRSKVI